MDTLIQILIGLVAIIHLYFMWLEMVTWRSFIKKVYKTDLPEELLKPTKILVTNQGLYNGFLAVGLLWTFFIPDEVWKINVAVFFLSCITVAGIFGAVTADRKIFYIQALPAIITLLVIVSF
jgi:putative membrane protein